MKYYPIAPHLRGLKKGDRVLLTLWNAETNAKPQIEAKFEGFTFKNIPPDSGERYQRVNMTANGFFNVVDCEPEFVAPLYPRTKQEIVKEVKTLRKRIEELLKAVQNFFSSNNSKKAIA